MKIMKAQIQVLKYPTLSLLKNVAFNCEKLPDELICLHFGCCMLFSSL